MKETWKTTQLAPRYEVSSFGRVRRLYSLHPPKLIKPTLKNGRHLAVNIWTNGVRKGIYVHKLVCDAFLGPRPIGQEVNHKNCNTRDNHLLNLEYVSHKQNVTHASQNGHIGGWRKLTEQQVQVIWHQLHCRKFLYRIIAQHFNIAYGSVRDIDKQKTWKYFTQFQNAYSRKTPNIQCNPSDYSSSSQKYHASLSSQIDSVA